MQKYWEAGARHVVSRAKQDGRVIDVVREARWIGDLYADAPEMREIVALLISAGVTEKAGLHLGCEGKPAGC